MARLVGGVPPFAGLNNRLVGTMANDVIFGDPFTRGNRDGVVEGDAELLSGTGGADHLEGGAGRDRLYGDAFVIAGTGQGGHDRLLGGSGGSIADPDILYGDADAMRGSGRGGDDELDGGTGVDLLLGDAAELGENAQGGADRLDGGSEDDLLCGDGWQMLDSSVGGDDYLTGGSGADLLYGDAERLWDSAACGDDVLVGGGGADTLWGDGLLPDGAAGPRGADRFVFYLGTGEDRIGDFQTGTDKIQVGRGYGYANFAALQGQIADNAEGDAVVRFAAGHTVTLEGVASAALTSGDFLFA